MRNKFTVFLVLAALILSACGTLPHRKVATPAAPAPVENKIENQASNPVAPVPGSGGYLPGDGPGADIPVNLDAIPDAIPKKEPLHPYANRPYIALGKTYKPMTVAGNFKQRGIASWYGKKFNGARTSSGEIYDMYAMSAAHPTLPVPSYARVTNLANQKSVIVRINDRGPFMHDRIIDLSYTAAYKLGIIGDGSAEVEVDSVAPDAKVNTVADTAIQNRPAENNLPAPDISAASAAVAAPAAVIIPPEPAVAAVSAPPAVGTSNAAATPAAEEADNKDIYLQLGAFSSIAGAKAYEDKMRSKLAGTGKQFKLTTKDGLVRVHIGPYANVNEARESAEEMEEELGFKPMVNLP